MSGKMNWDRVRKESLARSHGSTWTPSVVELARWNEKSRTKKKQKRRKKRQARKVSAAHLMPGCTCGKEIGFSGQHKSTCPLRNSGSKAQPSRSDLRSTATCPSLKTPTNIQTRHGDLSLSDLVIRLNRVRLDSDLKNLLDLWEKRLRKDAISSPTEKQLVAEAISALRAEIAKYA